MCTSANPILSFFDIEKKLLTTLSDYFPDSSIQGVIYDYLKRIHDPIKIEDVWMENLQDLHEIRNLQEVTLDGSLLSLKCKPDIQSLGNCLRLKNLALEYLYSLIDEDITVIAQFSSLEFLSIHECPNLTYRTVEYLKISKSLRVLEIGGIFITNCLDRVIRNGNPILLEDQQLVSKTQDAVALNIQAKYYDKDTLTYCRPLAERIRRYLDYSLLVNLRSIRNLRNLNITGIIGSRDLSLIKARLEPVIKVKGPR